MVIGSEAIQEGMNLQENTTDIYMLSLPYNFTSLRQVEGRAWRHPRKSQNIQEQPKTGLEERGLDTAEPMAQADGWHTS